MGRPSQCNPCCGEWYTTEKLTYDDGIKKLADTDFFYDHSSATTGSGEYSPSYGWLETWDVYPDVEGITVFARGVDFNNSLDRFTQSPWGDSARCRRVYDLDLKEIGPVTEDNTNYYFDKGILSNANNSNAHWLPLPDEEVYPNDIGYKSYRNPNNLINQSDMSTGDFYTIINRRNVFNYIYIGEIVTDGRVYYSFQMKTGYENNPNELVTVYSVINWPVLYDSWFLKYNPTYTSVPENQAFINTFYLQDVNTVRGAVQVLYFETDSQYIYVFVDVNVTYPSLALPNASAGTGTLNVIIKLDFNFNVINVYDYNIEIDRELGVVGNISFQTGGYIRKVRIKNGKIYVLRIKQLGGLFQESSVLNAYSGYGEDIINRRRAYTFDVINLSDYSIQPRFTGGVNYPKYGAIYAIEGSKFDVGRTTVFNNGSLLDINYNTGGVNYDDSDINDVLDSALILPLCSNTNYIEIYTQEVPAAPRGYTNWEIDSVTGGSIIDTSYGKNGVSDTSIPLNTDFSFGLDKKTTVLIDFSGVSIAIIVLKKVLLIQPEGQQSYQKTIYRAIKYKKGTFFNYISRPKDFDVDSNGDIYMLMDHDSVVLPSETTLLNGFDFDIPQNRFRKGLDDGSYYGFQANDYTRILYYQNNTYDTAERDVSTGTTGRVTTDREKSVHIPFEKGLTNSYYPGQFQSYNRLQYNGIAANSEIKSVIYKNGGIRPEGTEYADVVKISGQDGSLIDGAVYFNSWLSTGLKYKKQVRKVSQSNDNDKRQFFFETFAGVPVNCIEVNSDGVWVGGGQVWPTYGTLGDFVPPRWPDFYNSDNEFYQYDTNATNIIKGRPSELDSIYVVPIVPFFSGNPPVGLDVVVYPTYKDTAVITNNNRTYISPAWNTDAIQIEQGDFEWLVGWVDVSDPRNPDIGEQLYKVPYNATYSSIPTKSLPNFNPIIVGGPPIQQDIVIDGVNTYAVFDAFDLEFVDTGFIGGFQWEWKSNTVRHSTVTGVCYTDEAGSFFPASSRNSGTYLKASYPYNLLLFDFDLNLKDKYYFGPSNMDYDKLSSQYIMSQFSQINGMCSIGDDIYITGNRRHDDIIHCAGDESANDDVE